MQFSVTSILQKIAEKFTAMGILDCFLITGQQLNLTCSGIPARRQQKIIRRVKNLTVLLIVFGGLMKYLLRNISADIFNRRYPVGSRFRYYIVPGMPEVEVVTTTSEAWHVRNGRLVVRVAGKIGGVSVNKLEPIQ